MIFSLLILIVCPQEAQEAHGKTDYFRELGAQMGGFMAGAPEIKVLESV